MSLPIWDKLLHIKVDVYKNTSDLSVSDFGSWLADLEEGGPYFLSSKKPTHEDIGTLPNIKFLGSYENNYNCVEVTPYMTTGQQGEAVNIKINDSKSFSDIDFSIDNIESSCIISIESLPWDDELIALGTNVEHLYHIQIPFSRDTNDYVSIYICWGFASLPASTKANVGRYSVITFLNKNTIANNIYSKYSKPDKLDPQGLSPSISSIALIATHSSGKENDANDVSIISAVSYVTNDETRLKLVGGIVNKNMLNNLNTITPNVTP